MASVRPTPSTSQRQSIGGKTEACSELSASSSPNQLWDVGHVPPSWSLANVHKCHSQEVPNRPPKTTSGFGSCAGNEQLTLF